MCERDGCLIERGGKRKSRDRPKSGGDNGTKSARSQNKREFLATSDIAVRSLQHLHSTLSLYPTH